MKITLSALNARYTHSSLALLYLQKFNINKNIDIKEFTINDNIWNIYEDLLKSDCEVYGFSCYIWNIEITLKICEMLKKGKEKCKIFLGGPEVTYNPKEVLERNPFIDFCMLGEGEIPLGRVYDALLNGLEIDEIEGIATRNSINYQKEPLDLTLEPLPYNDEDIKRLDGKIIYFETSRGCPYNCSYCLSSAEHDLRYFSMEYVKSGFDLFFKNNVPLVKLIDRTFNANKKRAMEIIQYIMDNSKNTRVHFEIAPQLLDDDIINLLHKAPKDLFQLEMGIQSTNPKTLDSINRKADTNICAKNIKKIRQVHNMHIHLDLIAGLMYEDYNSFSNSFDDVFNMKPDMLQLGFLKVLNGTQIKNETEILSLSFPPYEVVSTKWISASEICKLKEIDTAVDRYYNGGAFKRTIEKLIQFNKPFELFSELANVMQKENGGISRLRLYEIIYERYQDEILIEVALDFLENNKSYKLPSFIKRTEPNDFKKKCHNLLTNEKFMNEKNLVFDLKNIRIEPILNSVYLADYINGMIYDVGEYF